MIPEAQALLNKAFRSLEAARRDVSAGDADNAISRAYYATFHAASAALLETGRAAKSHSGMQHLFSEQFIRTGLVDPSHGQTFSTLFQDRHEADYKVSSIFSVSEAADLVRRAEAFVIAIETLTSNT